MAISDSEPLRVVALGNDVATVFSFSPMTIFVNTDLVVTHVSAAGIETTLVEGTGPSKYSLTVPTYPGTGSITYPEDAVSPLPTGESLVMRPVLPLDQQQEYENQGGYFADLQERVVDRLTKMHRQQQEELSRAFKVALGQVTTVSAVLPSPLANATLAWNATADGIVNVTGALTQVVVSTGTWVPGIAFGGAAVGMTFSIQTGTYYRIGDSVFVRAFVTLTAKGSSTGDMTMTGLPFTSDGSTEQGLTIGRIGGMTGLSQSLTANITTFATSIDFYEWTSTGAFTEPTHAKATDNLTISLSGWYNV